MTRASNLAGFTTSVVGTSPNNLVVGVVTASGFVGNLTGNADTATTATSASGLSGTPNVVVGIVTATTLTVGGVTVSSAGVGIATAAGTVGTGITLIDLRGAGISTVTVSSGIATVNIEGGAGGGFSPINFILS